MTGQQTYYKAIRPDGGSFNRPQFKWNAKPGGVTVHPTGTKASGSDATHYLSVATVPTDCTGMVWPCRLLEVEPDGALWTPDSDSLPNKRAALAFRTIRELDPTFALGPQGAELDALIKRAKEITPTEVSSLYAARNAAWDAAWNAACDAAWDAAWGAARNAAWNAAWNAACGVAWGAAWDAARALVVRDLIKPGSRGWNKSAYDRLTKPWRTVIGPLHADDSA